MNSKRSPRETAPYTPADFQRDMATWAARLAERRAQMPGGGR